MRIITVPAMYAPEVIAEIQRIVDRVDRHRFVDVPGDGRLPKLAESIIPESSLDRGQTGTLMITIAESEADRDVKVFSIEQHRIAS